MIHADTKAENVGLAMDADYEGKPTPEEALTLPLLLCLQVSKSLSGYPYLQPCRKRSLPTRSTLLVAMPTSRSTKKDP